MDDLKRYLVTEAVEDYEEGRMSRRQVMTTLGGLVGVAMAGQLVAGCRRGGERAAGPAGGGSDAPTASVDATVVPVSKPLVAIDDPDVVAGAVEFAGEGATLRGYQARPAKAGPWAIVLVCHENRGLTAHIEDVTRRVAKAGYLGLAVDLLSRDGGTAAHSYDAAPGLLGNAPPERNVADFLAGLAHARAQAGARGDRVGMVGFCFGGGMSWRVAAALPELRAAVPFYGMPIEAERVASINAAVLAICAEKDDRINQALPAVEAAMTAAKKTFQKIVYPGTQHAFHNDTRERYDATAATAAWGETLAWFARYLA